MGAGWDRVQPLERNGKLTLSGYLVNAINAHMERTMSGLFKSLTGLPCPGCGYTRSMENLVAGDFLHSFYYNPGWIILIFFMTTMISIGLRSIITGRQLVLNRRWTIMFIVLLVSTWIGKFLLGSAYY